jgi:TRAP-type C4-dicarboxylate transport system permease small subunit
VPPNIARIGEALRRAAEAISAALLAIMFLAFIIQIAFRYLLNWPVGWTSEVSTLGWIWVVLWTAAFVTRENEEVRFDIVYGSVSEPVRRAFTILTGVALVAMFAVSLPSTISFIGFMGVEVSTYLRIPLSVLYSIYILFAVALIIRYGWLIWEALIGRKTPETDPSKLEI